MKPRLVLYGQRITFQWSRMVVPANDWPATPSAHNDSSTPKGAA